MVRNKTSEIELPMIIDPNRGLGVVVPMPLFGQLVAFAKVGMEAGGVASADDTAEKPAPARPAGDERAIWYAVPTDAAQIWLSSLDADSQKNVEHMMATYREISGRLAADPEDDADVAAYDAAKERDEELFPVEVADRLIAGEHPIKVFRKYRGMTQDRLAEKAGTTAAYLSQIETRRRTGSTGLLRRIAAALNVTVDDILENSLQD